MTNQELVSKIVDKVFTILDHIQIWLVEAPQRHDETLQVNVVCALLNSGVTHDLNEAISLATETLRVFRFVNTGEVIKNKTKPN